ncbi:type VI secretion system tip protein VgrG [Bermanella sp. R86510]|uniref:type VI secretion system tip protein VgrG n=1 Tax=unclassified Bermanella TaxID=2627862 RepID=UPI0037CAF780
MSQLVFNLTSDTFSANELEIVSWNGSEAISQFFEFDILFKIKNDIVKSANLTSLTQDDIVLSVDIDDGEECSVHQIKGIFSKVDEVFRQSNTHKFFSAKMVPSLWRKKNNLSYDVYTDQDVEAIIGEEMSQDVMLSHKVNLSAAYPQKEFVCQYSEPDFNFVSRIAEHWGIFYYFDHNADGMIIFADHTSYEKSEFPALPLDDSNNPSTSIKSVRSLSRQYNAVPDGVIVSETNPDQAAQLFQGLAGNTGDDDVVITLVDESADDKDEAELIAKIRLEEFRRDEVIFSGSTGLPSIIPGYTIEVDANGELLEILITQVSHAGNNLDNRARSEDKGGSQYYECSFQGIPKATQYRPERETSTPSVISTTGRVYSAANDQSLAERNEVGKYKVSFDFMKGEPEKISNWIRRSGHAARSNHLDMPLTPGTEVQIGFINGNPNRPYILNALENSQSVIHPVTHENPHHASLVTDGMFYTGALKSRQSLHMTAEQDPTEVKEHIKKHDVKLLDEAALDQGDVIDPIKGGVHIGRTYGNRYQWREGVDFNYGLSATYNFGQQYVENHAYQDKADGETFDVSDKLDSFDEQVAKIVRSDLQPGLAAEREVGFVHKDFGNRYNFHQGVERNWAQGINGNGHHVTMNFGGRYIENQLTADKGMPDISGINGTVSDTTLAIKTVGDEARYNEGVIDVHHKGDMKHIQTGSHTSDVTGDITETVTGNVTQDITGDYSCTVTGGAYEINQTLSGDKNEIIMAGGKMTIQATAGTEISSIEMTPSKKATISGNEDWIKGALKSEMVIGLVNDNFIGGKIETLMGLKITNTNAGEINIGKASDLRKTSARIDSVASTIEKHQSKIVSGTISMLKSKLNMIG